MNDYLFLLLIVSGYAVICFIIYLVVFFLSAIINKFNEKRYDKEVNAFLKENGEELLNKTTEKKSKSYDDIISKSLDSNNIRRL